VKRKYYVIGGVVFVLLAGALFYYLFFVSKNSGQALAMVNGEEITVERFFQEVDKIQEPTRAMFKEEPAEFLEVIIMKTLLLQEARKDGFQSDREGKEEEEAIRKFFEKKFSAPPTVTPEEIAAFYKTHENKMQGKTLEQLAPMIEQVIRQQKQEEEYLSFLQEVRNRAAVEINQKRLQAIAVKAEVTNTEEELANALKSGRPVLVDFGSNSCIPCRQLRPILQEIRKEQAGKMEVLVIDIYKHQSLADQYRIQVMPTLIFFDSTGKEVIRHQGFMPKTALMEQLKKVGIS